MTDADLMKYAAPEIEGLTATSRVIPASSITVAGWVPLKCQFGCNRYAHSYACPPYSPSPVRTRQAISKYRRALLFNFHIPPLEPDTREGYLRLYRRIHRAMIDLEGDVFKDGYYTAFVYLFGGCMICDEACTAAQNEPCRFGHLLRPSMESCGIDVFKTVRDNGFEIGTIRERPSTRSQFSLMLVD